MGLIEKADSFLLRHYRILVILLIFVVFLISVSLPISTFIILNGDLTKEINPSILNGILTATSIIFGFVIFELREIQSSLIQKLVLSIPLLLFLVLTLVSIFIGAIAGKITSGLALIVTINCLFNILYVAPVMIVKQTRMVLEQRRNLAE